MQTTTSGTNLMEAHAQWASRPNDERFETLGALSDAVNGRRMRSRSVDVECGRTRAAEDWKRRQAIFASVAEGIQRKQEEELLFPEGPEAAGDRYLVWKGVKL